MSGKEMKDCVYGMPLKFRARRVLRVLGDHDFEGPRGQISDSRKFIVILESLTVHCT
jgi:hypothetical protein